MRKLSLAFLALAVAACDHPVKVDLEPATLQLHRKGERRKIHATPRGRNGAPFPASICEWSSSDPRVASVDTKQTDVLGTVKEGGNEVVVVAESDGSAEVKCTLGDITSTAPVAVRFVKSITVAPEHPVLQMLDDAQATRLDVTGLDAQGKPVPDRPVSLKCADENVCRGDSKSGLWAVGPGDTKVTVQVDDAQTEVGVHVVDARTAEGKPRAVKGNPMLEFDRYAKQQEKKAAKEREKKK